MLFLCCCVRMRFEWVLCECCVWDKTRGKGDAVSGGVAAVRTGESGEDRASSWFCFCSAGERERERRRLCCLVQSREVEVAALSSVAAVEPGKMGAGLRRLSCMRSGGRLTLAARKDGRGVYFVFLFCFQFSYGGFSLFFRRNGRSCYSFWWGRDVRRWRWWRREALVRGQRRYRR